MGYYMDVREQSFFLANSDKDAALAAIKAMYDAPDASENMSGSTWHAGQITERHFGWTTTSEVLNAETLEDALVAWRWGPAEWCDHEQGITQLDFTGQKIGDDWALFKAIAPFVKNGSYIAMTGEDGAIWRWYFKNGQCIEQEGVVTWQD